MTLSRRISYGDTSARVRSCYVICATPAWTLSGLCFMLRHNVVHKNSPGIIETEMDATVIRSSRFRFSVYAASKLQFIVRVVFLRNRSKHQDRIPKFPHALQSSFVLIAFDCLPIREDSLTDLRNYATDTITEMLEKRLQRVQRRWCLEMSGFKNV